MSTRMGEFYLYLAHRLGKVFRPGGMWGRWAPIGALCWVEVMLVIDVFFLTRKLLGIHSRIENPYLFGLGIAFPILVVNFFVFFGPRDAALNQKAFAHYSRREQNAADALLVFAFTLAMGLVLFWVP